MYRGIFLADLHIGAMSYKRTYEECMYIKDLIREYTKEEPLDFIIIGGDFFDKQLYGNDPYIALAVKMMMYILSSAKIVRVVNGTSSHDSDQYKIFDSLVEELNMSDNKGRSHYNFKVIYNISEEDLFPNLKVLYVPEEYVVDPDSYYEEFLSKKNHYDYIFGHGMIKEAFSFQIKTSHNSNDHIRRRVAVFNSSELAYACKGKVYFGHYHVYTNLSDKVFYVGSTCRWQHGEEEDKGFFYLTTSPDIGEYKESFVINDKTKKYVTVSYGYNHSIFSDSSIDTVENETKKLLKRKDRDNIDFLRIFYNIPMTYENPEGFIEYIRGRLKNVSGITYEFINGYIGNKKENENETVDSVSDEYKFLLDKSVPEEDKLSYFIKMRLGVEISPEKIKNYLELEG